MTTCRRCSERAKATTARVITTTANVQSENARTSWPAPSAAPIARPSHARQVALTIMRAASTSASVQKNIDIVSGCTIAADLGGERAEREQAERGEVGDAPPGEHEPAELEQKHCRAEQEEGVHELDDPERIAEPERAPHPDRPRRNGVEAGWCVVLADPVREALAVQDPLRVRDVVDRVVAEPRRVAQHVPRRDHGERSEERDRPAAVPGGHAADRRPVPSRPSSPSRYRAIPKLIG